MDKICVFFGHRKIIINNDLIDKLKALIVSLIENIGINVFLFGGYGQFDELCNNTVKELQSTYTNLKRIYVRPYAEILPEMALNAYRNSYDDCIYLPPRNSYGKLSILYRNYEMVDLANIVFFM